jgi:hypothetical protein
MPIQPLTIKPGVQLQQTPLLAAASWVAGNLIRFKDGMLQKLGGWVQLLSTALIGTCRGMISWEDFSATNYLALGTEQRLTVYVNGVYYDITPIQQTDNLTNQLTTTNASATISIADSGYSPNIGDWIQFVNPMYINGVNLLGFYQVVTGGDPYTIVAAQSATSGSTGGTALQYSTTNTSTAVTVNFNNHGYTAGSFYIPAISTTVGGITFAPTASFIVNTATTNSFTITALSAATSTTTGYENGGAARINYLLPTGPVSAYLASAYGQSYYSSGSYGTGGTNAGTLQPLRQWFFGKWGDSIVCNYMGGGIYFWNSENGELNNPATLITQAPNIITGGIFVAGSAQQIIAMGAGPSAGVGDPMLVRWCDSTDFTDWTASTSNQAGSFRPSRGSRMVGGLSGPNMNLLLTDLGIWAMQYLGLPLVWGFTEIGQGCGLIAARAIGTLGEIVIWMSQKQFFLYAGGAPQPIPCTVWDQVFNNINTGQLDKVLAAPNSYFNEMAFFYPSAASAEVDSYVKMQITPDGVLWDYGSLVRTAFVDQTAFGPPMGVDGTGLVQQHEIANDNNGIAMSCYAQTGWFKIADGDMYLFLERMLPNFKTLAGNPKIQLTVLTQEYGNAGQPVTNTYGPFTITQATDFVIVRARGRLASIKISSSDLGSSWRLGEVLFYVSPSGRR